jgi:hypothetical protein
MYNVELEVHRLGTAFMTYLIFKPVFFCIAPVSHGGNLRRHGHGQLAPLGRKSASEGSSSLPSPPFRTR